MLKGDPFLELHVFLRTLLVPSALEQDHQKRILEMGTLGKILENVLMNWGLRKIG